ncbi:MAG TPA: hypothetical protein VEA58_05860, partial [Anaerovoracaceae bacterium]|nr:hypothetical protein [Anaerovoracaceae bacterium]
SHPKIWIIRIQKMRWFQRIVSAVDARTNTAGMKTLQSITSATDDLTDLYYLQAILASKLINFWCVNYLADDINGSYLSKIPIKACDTVKESNAHNEITDLVFQMTVLKKEWMAARLESKKQTIQSRIDFIDGKINKMIYAVYNLSGDEIALVEGER